MSCVGEGRTHGCYDWRLAAGQTSRPLRFFFSSSVPSHWSVSTRNRGSILSVKRIGSWALFIGGRRLSPLSNHEVPFCYLENRLVTDVTGTLS